MCAFAHSHAHAQRPLRPLTQWNSSFFNSRWIGSIKENYLNVRVNIKFKMKTLRRESIDKLK